MPGGSNDGESHLIPRLSTRRHFRPTALTKPVHRDPKTGMASLLSPHALVFGCLLRALGVQRCR